jgi:hypothetical protein
MAFNMGQEILHNPKAKIKNRKGKFPIASEF